MIRTAGRIIICRTCGDAYLDNGQDTPAMLAFRDGHEPCGGTMSAHQIPTPLALRILVSMPTRVSH